MLYPVFQVAARRFLAGALFLRLRQSELQERKTEGFELGIMAGCCVFGVTLLVPRSTMV